MYNIILYTLEHSLRNWNILSIHIRGFFRTSPLVLILFSNVFHQVPSPKSTSFILWEVAINLFLKIIRHSTISKFQSEIKILPVNKAPRKFPRTNSVPLNQNWSINSTLTFKHRCFIFTERELVTDWIPCHSHSSV